jgi:hypothetical protein
MTEEAPKTTTSKRTSKPTRSRKPKTAPRRPDQDAISARAYFIHLEEGGSDQLGNWLRAERELTAA